MQVSKIYSMIYDSAEYGDNGYGEYLGEFRVIKQLREDAWIDDFIGINTSTNELCVILSTEIKGQGGGIAYRVIPANDVNYPILGYITFAEWKMTLDDFEDGLGNRELPHCTKCGGGTYRHDAGRWCPFCGSIMKNPLSFENLNIT